MIMDILVWLVVELYGSFVEPSTVPTPHLINDRSIFTHICHIDIFHQLTCMLIADIDNNGNR